VKLAKLDRSGQTVWAAIGDSGAVDLTPVLGVDPRAIRDHLPPDGIASLSEYSGRSPDIDL